MDIPFLGTTTVGWLGPHAPSSLPMELSDWELVVVDSDKLPLEVDLLVVETIAFPTLRDCERFATGPACPVLYITELAEVTEIVNGLHSKDDILLAGSPMSLLAARLAKLHQSQRVMVDPLTGVQRREAYFGYLRQWSLNARQQDPLSLILADLDHLKTLNDQFGQQVGDEVLQRFGQVLRSRCKQSPLIARLGGQEFAVLLQTDPVHAKTVAERIRSQTCALKLSGDCQTSVSIGVASRQDVHGLDRLYDVADEALYAAKAAGRNRVCLYRDLNTQSMLNGQNPDLVSLENKSRVLGERVTSYVAQRSRRILQSLRDEAETDGLTQFYTRRYLDRRLKLQFLHHQETDRPLSIALIDIDHFGEFNKHHGWPTGDKALTTLGDLIRRHIRSENDWVGRYGGEEFVVVLPDVMIHDAVAVCGQLRAAAEATSMTSTCGQRLSLTLSIGVAQCDGTDGTLEELIERLSKLTLQAKEQGRNRVCWESSHQANGPLQKAALFPASTG